MLLHGRMFMLFELRSCKQHAILQFAKVGMNPLDEWLNQIGYHVFEVLDDTQCHLYHGFHGNRFKRSRCAAFHNFAPVTNAFPVLVDLRTLNLHCPNDHFAMSANVLQQRRNGQCMFAAHVIRSLCNARVKLPLNLQKMPAEQCRTASHNAELRMFQMFHDV